MQDPNLKDFYERIGRLQKARAKGFAFEAPGTLGRSFYHRAPKRRGIGLAMPVVFLMASVFGLKGAIHSYIGAATYDSRVSSMEKGEGFDRLGAVLMQADPVTLWVSSVMREHIKPVSHDVAA